MKVLKEKETELINLAVQEGIIEIQNGGLDVYDYSSAEFSINYHNTIEIENLDFNTDAVTDELSNILLDQFQESFGKLLNSEDE